LDRKTARLFLKRRSPTGPTVESSFSTVAPAGNASLQRAFRRLVVRGTAGADDAPCPVDLVVNGAGPAPKGTDELLWGQSRDTAQQNERIRADTQARTLGPAFFPVNLAPMTAS
jgi:hypothetical protein